MTSHMPVKSHADAAVRITAAPHNKSRAVQIVEALSSVADPEIPVLNVIEMGMIASIRIDDSGVSIDVTPTFVGCPAIDVIRRDVLNAAQATGEADVSVNIVFDPPWTSDRITEEGRKKLREFGVAPPGDRCGNHSLPALERVECPHCHSAETDLESIFGPTLCRSIHYCRNCRQSFEHFKSVG